MCDEGRYGWKYVHDPSRVTTPQIRGVEGFFALDWSEVPRELAGLLSGKRLAAVLSPQLTVEEAYLLARYLRSIDGSAFLAMGWVPRDGTDEKFPGGLVIHSEKCPNRRGVEEVLRHVTGEVHDWNAFLAHLDAGDVDAAWMTGGYPGSWVGPELTERLPRVETWIVQDCFESELWNGATVQLPAAAFAEREGSFVNGADRLQSFRWAVRPPQGVLPDGSLAWQLLGRTGLYNARQVLDELARENAFFASAAGGVPEHGVALKVTEVVGA
jgi:NADH-quinone oxidoreductase subunit G